MTLKHELYRSSPLGCPFRETPRDVVDDRVAVSVDETVLWPDDEFEALVRLQLTDVRFAPRLPSLVTRVRLELMVA